LAPTLLVGPNVIARNGHPPAALWCFQYMKTTILFKRAVP
jgi:hypothetical protein